MILQDFYGRQFESPLVLEGFTGFSFHLCQDVEARLAGEALDGMTEGQKEHCQEQYIGDNPSWRDFSANFRDRVHRKNFYAGSSLMSTRG